MTKSPSAPVVIEAGRYRYTKDDAGWYQEMRSGDEWKYDGFPDYDLRQLLELLRKLREKPPLAEVVREYLAEEHPEAVVFDGLDAAIIGVATRHTQEPLVAYSLGGILECLRSQGMTDEEALEWYDHNIGCLWAGEGTPVIVEVPVS